MREGERESNMHGIPIIEVKRLKLICKVKRVWNEKLNSLGTL